MAEVLEYVPRPNAASPGNAATSVANRVRIRGPADTETAMDAENFVVPRRRLLESVHSSDHESAALSERIGTALGKTFSANGVETDCSWFGVVAGRARCPCADGMSHR